MAGHPASLLLSSSFRRKPESSVFALARHSSASWNPAFAVAFDSALTASVRFSARIRASGSLFFACTKKSNQKKCTPGAAPSALRATGAQGQAGVRSMGILPIRELARVPARDPVGRFRPALAAADVAQDQEQQSKSCFASAFRFLLLRAGRARSGSSRAPWPCGDSGRSGPAGGGARDRADSAVAQDVQSAEPGRWRAPDAHDARRVQGAGACFFGSFLCTSKERNPLA